MVIEDQVCITSDAEGFYFRLKVNKDKWQMYQATPKQFSL